MRIKFENSILSTRLYCVAHSVCGKTKLAKFRAVPQSFTEFQRLSIDIDFDHSFYRIICDSIQAPQLKLKTTNKNKLFAL